MEAHIFRTNMKIFIWSHDWCINMHSSTNQLALHEPSNQAIQPTKLFRHHVAPPSSYAPVTTICTANGCFFHCHKVGCAAMEIPASGCHEASSYKHHKHFNVASFPRSSLEVCFSIDRLTSGIGQWVAMCWAV